MLTHHRILLGRQNATPFFLAVCDRICLAIHSRSSIADQPDATSILGGPFSTVPTMDALPQPASVWIGRCEPSRVSLTIGDYPPAHAAGDSAISPGRPHRPVVSARSRPEHS